MADALIIQGYRFQSTERKFWNRFTIDEKWAYLTFAREKLEERKYRGKGNKIMHEWRTDLALDEKENRIHAARTDRHRPDPVPLTVWYEGPEALDSPGSIDDWVGIPSNADPFSNNRTWRFVKTLYKRNYRAAHAEGGDMWTTVRLYKGADRRNRVHDRIAVKVVDWRVSDSTINRKIAFLRQRYQNLDNLPDSDYILKPLYWVESNYRARPRDANGNLIIRDDGNVSSHRRRGIRSYANYCEGGTLNSLIVRYSRAYEDARAINYKIPEQFIWHVLKSLGSALYVLHTNTGHVLGHENEGQHPRGFMIHNDIKPQNVFLIPGRHRNEYPCVVLADFDHARLTSERDPGNGGTVGYIAPEYFSSGSDDDKDEDEDEGNENDGSESLGSQDTDSEDEGARNRRRRRRRRITSRSDRWAVAGIAWDLMNSKRGCTGHTGYNVPGLNVLRHMLHNKLRHQRRDFERRTPCHAHMKDLGRTPANLPEFTSWLQNFVNENSAYHRLYRPTAVRFVQKVQKHLHNWALVTHGRHAQHDLLRQNIDPFLPGRIWNVARRQVPAPVPEPESES